MLTLTEIASQIKDAVTAIANTERDLRFQAQLPESSTLRWSAEKIAEVQKNLVEFRQSLADLRQAEQAAKAAQAAEMAAGGGSSGGGLLAGFARAFARVGSWIGLEGTAATLAGAALTAAVVAGATYGIAQFAGSRAGDEPVHAGPAMRQPQNMNQSSASEQPTRAGLPAAGTTQGDPAGIESTPASLVEKWIYRDYDKKAGKDIPGGYTTTFKIFKDGTAKAADGGTGNISYTDNEIKNSGQERAVQIYNHLESANVHWADFVFGCSP